MSYVELGAIIGTETEKNVDFLVFDWHTEYNNLLRGIKARLGTEKFEELSPLLNTSRAEFFSLLPNTLKQDIKQSLKYQLLSTLWEYTSDNTKTFPYAFVIRQDRGDPTKLVPLNYLYSDSDFLFDLFARAPLSQPHEILSPQVFDRRFDHRVDQTIGLHRAREYMITMSHNDLAVWLSPPGHVDDGYPGYSFIFFAQKQPNDDTVLCYSLIVPSLLNFHLSHQAALLNRYLPKDRKVPESPSPRDILHQAALIKNCSPQEVIKALNSILNSKLSLDPVDIDWLYQKHKQFIDRTLEDLFAGQSPPQLQRLFQLYNQKLEPDILQATGGSGTFLSLGR